MKRKELHLLEAIPYMVFDIIWKRRWLAPSISHERDSVTSLMKLLNHVKDCLCSNV